MIERTVLLHQHDDMLDVPNGAGGVVRGNRKRVAIPDGQYAHGSSSACGMGRGTEKITPTLVGHGVSFLFD
jgi:hypothetical protein